MINFHRTVLGSGRECLMDSNGREHTVDYETVGPQSVRRMPISGDEPAYWGTPVRVTSLDGRECDIICAVSGGYTGALSRIQQMPKGFRFQVHDGSFVCS